MPEIELDIGAQLIASLQTVAQAMAREEARHQRMAQAIRQVPITGNAPDASGNIQSGETMRVHDGFYGSIRRLVLSGFSAGTGVVYKNSSIVGVGEVMVPFSQAATFTFGKGEMLLNPGDRFIIQTSGITGTVQVNGAMDLFEMWFLPYYIG